MSADLGGLSADEVAVLRERARRLASSPASPSVEYGASVLLEVAEHRFALPLDAVREVLAPGPVSPVPGVADGLTGLRPSRGELVVVADLALILVGEPSPPAEECYVVVVEGAEALGLLAERVETATLPEPDRSSRDDVVRSVAADGTLFIDPAALLADRRLRVGERRTRSAEW